MISRTKVALVTSLALATLLAAPNVGYARVMHYDPSLSGVTSTVSGQHAGRHSDQQYTVQVSMVDKDGDPFFSGFDLVDQNGNHYSRNWQYDNTNTGTCTFTGLPAGRYSIQFYYSTYHAQTPQIVVEHDRSVTVRLATETYTISGTVVDNSGAPLPDEQVLLEDPTNLGGYWPSTDANGEFHLTGVPNGTYTVEVVNGWTNDGPVVVTSQQVIVDNGNVELGSLVASN